MSNVEIFDTTFAMTILVILALCIPTVLLLANWFLHPGKIKNVLIKGSAYECGLAHVSGTANERYPVKYYLVAMLFLVFDLEVAFLYPWTVQGVPLPLDGPVPCRRLGTPVRTPRVPVHPRSGLYLPVQEGCARLDEHQGLEFFRLFYLKIKSADSTGSPHFLCIQKGSKRPSWGGSCRDLNHLKMPGGSC